MGGKGKKGGRGGNKYVHNHTYNPVARESDERKIERLHSMEVKRYQNYVDRNMKVITQYLPLDTIAYKKKKIGESLMTNPIVSHYTADKCCNQITIDHEQP